MPRFRAVTLLFLSLIAGALLLASACAPMTPREAGTVTGAGYGAALGAIAGGGRGAGLGAAIGGATGLLFGDLLQSLQSPYRVYSPLVMPPPPPPGWILVPRPYSSPYAPPYYSPYAPW